MPEQLLFEYAILRVMPRVEREEFINVGVILYCAKRKFLEVKFVCDAQRISAICGSLDQEELKQHLNSFSLIARGGKAGGPIGQLDLPSRFRWMTATRSTVVQTSKVHPGLCTDPADTLEKLYRRMVL